ncbi:MAG: RidA family protein [Ardenticatenales bacterium]|nr:RidA family protein [Ardenticatenales bacterium]
MSEQPTPSRNVIHTEDAPKAVGPYSQAIQSGPYIFTAGQIAIDPVTNQFVGGDIAQETKQVLSNLSAVLRAAGSGLDQVIKTTVFLTTMDHFTQMNEVYASFFNAVFPARSTVAVAGLPKGALVEIECVALVDSASIALT